MPELTRLLEDPDLVVVDAAAEGLRRLAAFAASAVPAVVEALRKSAIACEPSDILAAALVAINPPAEVLQELLDPIDVEIRKAMSKRPVFRTGEPAVSRVKAPP